MNVRSVALLVLSICILNAEGWHKALTRRIIASSIALPLLAAPMLPALAEDATPATAAVTVATSSEDSSPVAQVPSTPSTMTFADFVPFLQKGNVVKVVFKGVRPDRLIAITKEGKEIMVAEGFPAFDDPLSASGPQQAIALCQHTPGVEVYQDISDILSLSRTSKGYQGPQKMLQSSGYPKEYAYK